MPANRSGAPTFVLRELRWEDFHARVAGYLDLYAEVKENPDLGMTLMESPPPEPEEARWFSELYQRVQRGDDIAVVAEADGRAIGMVTVASHRAGGNRPENSHVGVLGILVDRAYRGRGVGTALMLRALERSRERFEIVRLIVFTVNTRARRLYERLGFRPTGRLPREVKRQGRYLDEEMMALDLATWRPPQGEPAA
jgi:RimJ/RimL family protein N-acetyltransferase